MKKLFRMDEIIVCIADNNSQITQEQIISLLRHIDDSEKQWFITKEEKVLRYSILEELFHNPLEMLPFKENRFSLMKVVKASRKNNQNGIKNMILICTRDTYIEISEEFDTEHTPKMVYGSVHVFKNKNDQITREEIPQSASI